LELPVILAASWLICGWTMRRFSPDPALGARLALGGVAFTMLIVAEAVLGIVGFGRTLAEHLASYTRPLALWGLGGQIAFALFPALRR
jgi:vacuolar-type H+-ATPase subunit I/STV1